MSNGKKKGSLGTSNRNIGSSTNINVSESESTILDEGKSKEMEALPVADLFKIANDENLLIALPSKQQVRRGKSHKSPAVSWDKTPRNYQGINDKNHGTAIRCDYIKALKRHLVVIDLDIPKKDGDIPIEVLKSVALPLTENTYSVKTPSGGVHIYFLSKEQPKQSQPKVNIDYQTNTGKGKGKYVVANYRWDEQGNRKEFYKKLPESPDTVLLVKNTDKGLENLLQTLVDNGHITTPKQEQWKEIADIFRHYTTGRKSVNNFSLAIAGYLRKRGYDQQATENIILEVFKNTGDVYHRKENVKQTYERPLKNIEGYQHLKNVLGKEDLTKLSELTSSTNGNVKAKILNYLSRNKEPSVKMVADHVNDNLELYKNLETNKYYERTDNGEFMEIDDRRIIEFCNDEFGVNNISSQGCQKVLKFVTRPVVKNYDLVEFKNGILNTKTREFTTDKALFDETPKIVLNLNWNSKAEPGEIGQIIDKILDHPGHPRDKEKWLRAVGHGFMGYNRIGKMVVVQGPSGTGKSTLTTILKRIFNYSEIPTSVINANERFTLLPMIDKDVNIDDDINNGILKSIGMLNTITTGNGLEVEIKGENRSIRAENHQIPRLFANGNTLPPVFGEGHERRLLLIHAHNIIGETDEREINDYLQGDIIEGKYDDKGMEWLVYTAITTYLDKKDEVLTTKKEEAQMKEEYEFKSYPMLKGVEALFVDDYVGIEYIPVREVNRWVKAWHIWAYEQGKISKEHRKPSVKQISNAMNKAGFHKRTRRDDTIVESVYEDIKLNENMEKVIRPYYSKLATGQAKVTK